MEDLKFSPKLSYLQNILKTLPECTKDQQKQIGELSAMISYNCLTFINGFEICEAVTRFSVTKFKKWDVVYMKAGATIYPHYHIILKITKDKLYCLSVTSKKTVFSDLEIKNCRQLKGYICNYITIISKEEAKDKFVFIYEGSKKEIRATFNTIMENLNSIHV